MSVARRRRIRVIALVFFSFSAVIGLALLALKQHIDVYYTPHELVKANVSPGAVVRLGGWVMKGSVVHESHSTRMHFQVTDHIKSVSVYYDGLLPSLFREGQGIVVIGHWLGGQGFKATQVLAKHDANYHPPGLSNLPKTNQESKS